MPGRSSGLLASLLAIDTFESEALDAAGEVLKVDRVRIDKAVPFVGDRCEPRIALAHIEGQVFRPLRRDPFVQAANLPENRKRRGRHPIQPHGREVAEEVSARPLVGSVLAQKIGSERLRDRGRRLEEVQLVTPNQ